jgi:hypothetical protein
MNRHYPFPAQDGFCAARGLDGAQPVALDDMHRAWMSGSPALGARDVINANQLTSLRALIAYVSFQFGQSEFGIERDFADHFNIPNVKCLPVREFENGLRYLVDMLPG